MTLKAIIFDLDGVIVSTDEFHYLAWKYIAEKENIPYDKKINERQRGVSRMESLDILLEKAPKEYSDEQKQVLATIKNAYYVDLIKTIKADNILDGVMAFLEECKKVGIKCAIGSSSKNTPAILKGICLDNFFSAVADGNDIKNSKPDPEVFLLAAQKLDVPPENCVVIEDADAGIMAAKAAGMFAVGVGDAFGNLRADLSVFSLKELSVRELIYIFESGNDE